MLEVRDEVLLHRLHIVGLLPLGAINGLKLNALAFLQCAEAFHVDCGMMNEKVGTLIIG